MKLSVNKISEIIKAESIGADSDSDISELLTDSRDLTGTAHTMFFAIKTEFNDGHNYIKNLYDKGVRFFVVDQPADYLSDELPEARFLVVNSVIDALQDIAKYVRGCYDIPVVGITGSRGKTILKETLYRMLDTAPGVVRSPRSYNSQIGVPLSIWQLSESSMLAILEAGISENGEMERLEPLIRPTIGVFTTLTDEHSSGFSTLKEKALEKAKLFIHCPTVIISEDGENVSIIEEAIKETVPACNIVKISGGYKHIAEYLLKSLNYDVDSEKLKSIPEKITSRIDVTETLKNCLVVYDSFTDDTRSVTDAVNFTRRHLTPGRNLTCILASDRRIDMSALAMALEERGVKRLIAIGEGYNNFKSKNIDFTHLKSVDDFLNGYTISDFANEVILVKGESGTSAEDIKSLLEAPRHQTVMEIDLGAITRNFNFFRSKINPNTGIVAMVKAAGYGVGSLELAKTLQNQGAAYLAVAVIDEGAELRRAGITMPIIVMNPISTNYKALFDNRLEPSVFSLRELDLLLDNANRYSVNDYPVHIKLDTGMHRLGFLPSELDTLANTLSKQTSVKVKSIFSHLATADCLDQDAYTQMQLDNFDQMSQTLIDKLGYPVLRHVLNTAGILRYPSHQYDMVRLGIGLYGVSPIYGYKLEPVARLLSTIISIKKWDEGITIGYGRKGKVERPSVIATVAIGYADGLNRHLSNGAAWVMVNGHKCKIIGNICMDQCMVDVTDANASISDTVEIFGPNAPIERLSATLDTIPYEILTSVSPRVKRIYFKD